MGSSGPPAKVAEANHINSTTAPPAADGIPRATKALSSSGIVNAAMAANLKSSSGNGQLGAKSPGQPSTSSGQIANKSTSAGYSQTAKSQGQNDTSLGQGSFPANAKGIQLNFSNSNIIGNLEFNKENSKKMNNLGLASSRIIELRHPGLL